MSKAPLVRALIGGGVIFAGGYGIMVGTTPTEKQMYDRLSPALQKTVDMKRSEDKRAKAYAEQLARAQQIEESPLGHNPKEAFVVDPKAPVAKDEPVANKS